MLNYIYDGSFDGLLTAIYESYYRRQHPNRILTEINPQGNILDENVHITTNEIKAKKVYNSIVEKISRDALNNVFYVYLSELEGSGSYIYEYLRFGWQVGSNIDLYLSDDRVAKVLDICRKVGSERHLMMGLTRFRALQDRVYYAPIEPQYNIVGLLAGHFIKRLSDQNWVIHDIKRGLAALYNQREWIVRDLDMDYEKYLSEDEVLFQNLWKEYFKSIAIKSRINPKLQRNNMPKKYWKYLIEKG